MAASPLVVIERAGLIAAPGAGFTLDGSIDPKSRESVSAGSDNIDGFFWEFRKP
jgi:hypothetical protein